MTAGIAVVLGVAAVPAALAAFTTSKLEVRQAATTTTFSLTQSTSDDALANARIFVPTGTTLTTTQAPGTVLGKAAGLLKLFALSGAEVPVNGNVVVAAPDQVSAASQQACTQGVAPLATWLLVASVAGTSFRIPIYLLPTAGAQAALGPAHMSACFPSPYLTPAQGGATGQPQLVRAEFSVQGVFSPVAAGAFVAIVTPYTVGTGTANVAGTVASPAQIATGAVTLAAKTSRRGAIVTGSVTQAGQPRGGATVTVRGGSTKGRFTTTKKVRVGANGRFSAKFAVGTFFRATAVAPSTASASLCSQLGAALAPIRCVNPTVSAFSAQSNVVRKTRR